MPNDVAEFNFGGPATYRIVIQGMVSKDWHTRFGDMKITTSSRKTGVPQTTLRGRIRDQAALHGLFETLYALHLPILEVTKIDSPSDTEPAESQGESTN